MDDRHLVAEPRAKAADRLWRERDLRDEHDRPEPARQCLTAGLEIDLGLPASRRACEQDVLTDTLVERRHDATDRGNLRLCQRLGLCFTFERLALGRRLPHALRGAPDGRDELERTRRCRPVVLRQPEREIDECRWNRVEQAAHRDRSDAGGRLDTDIDDDAARLLPPQPDCDDGSLG